jgi:hypothetical protein
VVHVLTNVLRKLHRSLRSGGAVLVVQPTRLPATVQLQIDGRVVCSEVMKEPNFGRYLAATHLAIQDSLQRHLFVLEDEAVTPAGPGVWCDRFASINDWLQAYQDYCEDKDELTRVLRSCRAAAASHSHTVLVYRREYRLRLRKRG